MPELADSIREIQKTGYIELECLPSNGLKGGRAYLHLITTDIKAALSDAEIVLVVAPAYGSLRDHLMRESRPSGRHIIL